MNIANIKLKTIFTKKNLILTGFLYIKDKNGNIERNNLKLELNEKDYKIKFLFKRIKKLLITGIISNFYIVKIPLEDLLTQNIHNKPFFIYKKDEIEYKYSLRYSILGGKKYLNSRVKILKDINTSIYVRQSAKNRLIITVREINKTDYLSEKIKINLAYVTAKFLPKTKIMMYEKHSEKYEESASIVYEKLIDEGYKNIRYILNKENKILKDLQEKYRSNIIYKYSFKHYLLFFSAKALIGSESPGHAIELRVANKHAAQRIYNGKYQYVFLQHGVMYMVSLDSDGRSFFRKNGGMPKNSKIVVSSNLEAQHFINYGGFDKEDLYITGLPKYDKNKWNEESDKVVIMLTWRPWEYNEIRNDIYNSGYYRLLIETIDSIPEKLRNKIVLMPHPLILEDLKKSDLSNYIQENFEYDKILENTKVLITDYSSIAYDAFYRGANVVFYWKEKEYCMEKYNGHLMLNDDNAFGITCYNSDKLSKAVEIEYKSTQDAKHIERYNKIVQFHDNKNTERLVKYLKRDKII